MGSTEAAGRMRRIVLGLAAALALTGAGCGGSGGDGKATESPTGAAPQDSPATLTMTDNAFSPAAFTLSANSAELVNEGQALHNLSVEGEKIDHDVEAGASTTIEVDLEPGDYTMFCKYHRAQGMVGSLTIE